MHNSRTKKLTLLGALAISFTAIAPTCAMGYNTTAVAKFAGIHMPLSFIFGGIAILLIGFCFAIMANQTSGVGSVYSYNRLAMGEGTGFITGWLLTLVYVVGGAGAIGMSTQFIEVFLSRFGVHLAEPLIAFGLLILMYAISLLGIRSASEISLAIEIIAILILAVICGAVMFHHGAQGLSLKPFEFSARNLPKIGQGIIYVVICFAGFEEATTMTIRTSSPKRTVPFAIIATIVLVALIFIAVCFLQVVGYGTAHVNKLIQSPAPLNDLAVAYVGNGMATLIDLATMISSVASFLGIMNAGAYMLFALGKQHYLPRQLGRFNRKFNGPFQALNTIAILYAIEYLLIGVPFGAKTIYTNLMAIAGLGFLIVYILVCLGMLVYSHHQRIHHLLIEGTILPVVAIVVLLFPLASNLYPIPPLPMNLYPYIILAYIIIGVIMYRVHRRNS